MDPSIAIKKELARSEKLLAHIESQMTPPQIRQAQGLFEAKLERARVRKMESSRTGR